MNTITFLGDYIAKDFTDENLWNRYLEQHITNSDNNIQQQFTRHPQIDSAVFRFFNNELKFTTFDNFNPGRNLVIIGLHGGWNIDKLNEITEWFNKDENHKKSWFDANTKIVIDYTEEGFTTEVFPDLYDWIEEHELEDRVLYVNSTINVDEVYHKWCRKYRCRPNMRTAWYGFFTIWLLRDRLMCRTTTPIAQARYTPGKPRFMSLNRRPYQHRILLLTLLQRHNLLEHGAISMPKHFTEREIAWAPEDFDIPLLWSKTKDGFVGYIDHLEADFTAMYNKLPLIADTSDFSTNYALNLNDSFYSNFPINLVTETLFFTSGVFASEKIWKPMLMGQIFIVMSSPLYLKKLRSLGFKTFDPYISEEYDLIEDHLERANEIVKVMVRLTSLSEAEFEQLLANVEPILEHNRQLLMDRNQVEELVCKNVVQTIESLWDDNAY